MAIRIRKVDGYFVALCAAETKAEPGDLYLDDNVHYALSGKFYDDQVKMGFIKKLVVTEEFVEKWNQAIAERVNVQMKKDFIREEIGLVYPGTENLTQMLEKAGVEIRETEKIVKK